MADKARKAAKLKLIMGVTIPVFVMVASLIMVGVSFAWFSTSADTEIATINLTTKKVFTLDFETLATTQSLYHGENALGADGYLISDYRKITQSLSANYLDDSAFMFKTTIGLSTEGIPVDLNMAFNLIQIVYDPTLGEDESVDSANAYDLSVYGMTSSNSGSDPTPLSFAIGNAPYAFTWFFVESGTYSYNSETEKWEPFTASTIYTPYGVMELDYPRNGSNEPIASYRVATTLNGEAVVASGANQTSILGETPSGISHFSANKTAGVNKSYDFYIVFAPQELFWMQFIPADRERPYYNHDSNNGVYSSTELTTYISRGSTAQDCKKMYYAAPTYTGAKFRFQAEINVSEIYWAEAPAED